MNPTPSAEYTFALLIAGLDVADDAQCDAYFAAGLDDSIIEDRDGLALATFFRTAASPESALTSAIRDIERGVRGTTVLRIDDQLVDPGGLAETLPPALIAATNLQLDAAARRVGDG